MSGTHVFYNGVLLRDCELIDFDQVIEKDKSGTDPIYSRFRVSVASMLVSMPGDTEPHHSTIGPPLPERNVLVDRLAQIRERLQAFRKDFWMAINGSTPNARQSETDPPANDTANNDPYRVVLAAAGLSDDKSTTGKLSGYYAGLNLDIDRRDVIDADNGPKTSNVQVTRIDGGQAMRVQLTIEVCRCVCSDNLDPTTPPVRDAAKVEGVISHRWSVMEGIDDLWRTNYTIEGTLIVRDQRYKPDAMRLMTSQHLIPYAKMMGREFYIAEDGLTLRYRYTMQEKGPAPPPLIVDWEGTYTERSDQSAVTLSVLNCKVKGSVTPPNGWALSQYKAYMIAVLWKLIQARITLDPNNPNKVPGTNPHTHIIKDLSIIEVMDRPEVGMNIIVQNHADPLFLDFRQRLSRIGSDLKFNNYDPRWWPIPAMYTWDTATMEEEKRSLGSVYDGYYHTPCSEWHGKPRGILATEQAERNAEDQVFAYAGQSAVPDLGTYGPFPYTPGGGPPQQWNWSEDQFKGASYIAAEIENQYGSDEGNMVLPLSKPRATSNGFETVAIVPIHAGVTTRKFRMICKRQNDWPKIPAPKKTLKTDGTGGTVETLLSSKIIPESPKLGIDGRTFTYTIQCQFEYVVNRAPTSLRVSRDPRVKPIRDNDLPVLKSDIELPIAHLYDYGDKIERTGPA